MNTKNAWELNVGLLPLCWIVRHLTAIWSHDKEIKHWHWLIYVLNSRFTRLRLLPIQHQFLNNIPALNSKVVTYNESTYRVCVDNSLVPLIIVQALSISLFRQNFKNPCPRESRFFTKRYLWDYCLRNVKPVQFTTTVISRHMFNININVVWKKT